MNLAIIGRLHLIQELFGEIIIPKEVWAEFYSLAKTGVLGILMSAKKRSLIKQIKPMLEKLRIQAHFWIKPDLYDAILSEMGETPLR